AQDDRVLLIPLPDLHLLFIHAPVRLPLKAICGAEGYAAAALVGVVAVEGEVPKIEAAASGDPNAVFAKLEAEGICENDFVNGSLTKNYVRAHHVGERSGCIEADPAVKADYAILL